MAGRSCGACILRSSRLSPLWRPRARGRIDKIIPGQLIPSGTGYGCSTVVLICFTCPAITVATVILRALERVRERALGCFARLEQVRRTGTRHGLGHGRQKRTRRWRGEKWEGAHALGTCGSGEHVCESNTTEVLGRPRESFKRGVDYNRGMLRAVLPRPAVCQAMWFQRRAAPGSTCFSILPIAAICLPDRSE